MQMPRRTTLRVESIFENQETIFVLSAHLEVNLADAEPAMFTEPIVAGCNAQYGRKTRRNLLSFSHQVLRL